MMNLCYACMSNYHVTQAIEFLRIPNPRHRICELCSVHLMPTSEAGMEEIFCFADCPDPSAHHTLTASFLLLQMQLEGCLK